MCVRVLCVCARAMCVRVRGEVRARPGHVGSSGEWQGFGARLSFSVARHEVVIFIPCDSSIRSDSGEHV